MLLLCATLLDLAVTHRQISSCTWAAQPLLESKVGCFWKLKYAAADHTYKSIESVCRLKCLLRGLWPFIIHYIACSHSYISFLSWYGLRCPQQHTFHPQHNTTLYHWHWSNLSGLVVKNAQYPVTTHEVGQLLSFRTQARHIVHLLWGETSELPHQSLHHQYICEYRTIQATKLEHKHAQYSSLNSLISQSDGSLNNFEELIDSYKKITLRTHPIRTWMSKLLCCLCHALAVLTLVCGTEPLVARYTWPRHSLRWCC